MWYRLLFIVVLALGVPDAMAMKGDICEASCRKRPDPDRCLVQVLDLEEYRLRGGFYQYDCILKEGAIITGWKVLQGLYWVSVLVMVAFFIYATRRPTVCIPYRQVMIVSLWITGIFYVGCWSYVAAGVFRYDNIDYSLGTFGIGLTWTITIAFLDAVSIYFASQAHQLRRSM